MGRVPINFQVNPLPTSWPRAHCSFNSMAAVPCGCAVPTPRVGPLSAPIDGKLHVWGGCSIVEDCATAVYRFDSYQETWTSHLTRGSPHPGVNGCTIASAGHYLYIFGGEDLEGSYIDSLHQLDTATSVWTELSAKDGPMKKSACGMVVYDDKVVLFGGLGVPSGPIQPGSEYIPDNEGTGWTNELHLFNLKKGQDIATSHLCG